MENKCLLCCKRSGEFCRTNYFQQLVSKHLSFYVEGKLCICESCGQLLRHWDDFSAEAQANLSRKRYVEADSVGDCASGKSCDQETQTDFQQPDVEESPQHLSDHSYAKSLPSLPRTPSCTITKYYSNEYCQVDSSSLDVPYEGYNLYQTSFGNDSFYESPDSGIKILDVCELKDEQWFDDERKEPAKEENLLHLQNAWDPDFKIKEEPIDYDESTDGILWREDYFKPEISNDEDGESFVKPEYSPNKNENQPSSHISPEETVKEESGKDIKANIPAPSTTSDPSKIPVASHSCPLCDKEFPENDLLVLHLRTHENFFKPALHLACPDCNQEFQSEHILVEHILEYHETNENGEIYCVICGQLKGSRTELKKHIIGCHFCATPANGTKSVFEPEMPEINQVVEEEVVAKKIQKTTTFSCKLCNVRLDSRFKLKLHVENKHKGKKIVMKKASEEEMNTRPGLKKSVVSETKSNSTVVSKKLHFERNNRFYCKVCMKSFPSERGALCHITVIHKQKYGVPEKSAELAKQGPFPCRKCKKVFIYHKRLISHVCSAPKIVIPAQAINSYQRRYVKEDGYYCCILCSCKVKSYSGMAKHLSRWHKKSCTSESEKAETENTVSMSPPKPTKSANESISPKIKEEATKKSAKKKDSDQPELPPRDATYVKMKRRPSFFACEDCNRRFLKTKQLRIHRKRLCTDFIRNSQNNTINMYFLKRADHFLCNFCFKTDNVFKFTREEDVKTHLQLDHNLMVNATSESLYICKFCKLHYKAPAYLRQHIKQKHVLSEKEEAKSETEVAEETEVAAKTEPPAEKPKTPSRLFPCEICGKKLPLMIALQRHKRFKHPQPPVIIKTEPVDPEDQILNPASPSAAPVIRNVCTVCGKSFKLSIALSKHMASHSEAPKAATETETASVISENPPAVSSAHISTSTLVASETISAPSASAAPDSTSEAEPVVPTEVANVFKCRVCSKTFEDQEKLQAHCQSHEVAQVAAEKKDSNQQSQAAKRLTCDLCDKGLTFFSQVGLDQHKRKYHKQT